MDPGFDATKALAFLSAHELTLLYIILTHYHSDHTADAQRVRSTVPAAKVVCSKEDGQRLSLRPDIEVSQGSALNVGTVHLEFFLTPGHTPGGICILVDKKALLTGDTLFIGDCGRTDLPGGDLSHMFHSLHDILMRLPDDVIVYPGHDYGETPFDTLGNQKRTNKTLQAKTLKEFSMIP